MNLALPDQVRLAVQKQNRTAAIIGAWLSKLAPLGSFAVAHFAPLNVETSTGIFFCVLLAGCLAFSAPKLGRWARTTYGSWVEALGFVVLAERLSLAPHGIHWLLTFVSFDALLVLLAVNAITGAVKVALDQKATRAAREQARADAPPTRVAAPAKKPARTRPAKVAPLFSGAR